MTCVKSMKLCVEWRRGQIVIDNANGGAITISRYDRVGASEPVICSSLSGRSLASTLCS